MKSVIENKLISTFVKYSRATKTKGADENMLVFDDELTAAVTSWMFHTCLPSQTELNTNQ